MKIDLKDIVQSSIPKRARVLTRADESYVSTPKTYNQTSELVSAQTKEAHSKIYESYIEASNEVSRKLDTVDKSSTGSPNNEFRSLKFDESKTLNAKWLHELYFMNCFDPNSVIYMDTVTYQRLQRDWGTFDTWQKDMVACCKAAEEGWAVCAYSMHLKRYVNTIVSAHSDNAMLGLYPVIVIDMWAHAYYRDHLNDKDGYITTVMKEINWEIVEERVQKADAIAEVIK